MGYVFITFGKLHESNGRVGAMKWPTDGVSS